MNQTDGYTVNESAASTQNATSGYAQPIVGLHPGYTTLISLGIAIFIIIVYIYYQDVQSMLKRVCLRRGVSSQANPTKIAFTDNRGNGITSTTAIKMAEIQTTNKLLREPAIRCECGQVHILKECLNGEELERCRALFCHFRSDGDTKCKSVVEEITATPLALENSVNKRREISDLRVDEGFASNNELPHVVECELSANTANTPHMSAGVSSRQNSGANSEASLLLKPEGRSTSFSIISENATEPYCNDGIGTEHSNIEHRDASS